MCDLCRKVSGDPEYRKSIESLFNSINERIKATRQEPGDAVAFSITPFPNIDFALFEPRMSLQLPSHLYQSMNVDGQHLRSDWASGWLRSFGFKEKKLYLITQAFKRVEGKEILLYLYMVGFEAGEYSFREEGQKLILEVKDIKKEGLDLFADKTASHTFSFSFVHHPTDRAMVPKDRISSSALVKTAFHGRLPAESANLRLVPVCCYRPTCCSAFNPSSGLQEIWIHQRGGDAEYGHCFSERASETVIRFYASFVFCIL